MAARFESLKGKRVLITGSSRGIGRALAFGFAQNGADVAVHGIQTSPELNETALQLSEYGGRVVKVCGDLADSTVPQTILQQTIKALGGIDVLICNASIQIRKPWTEITHADMLAQAEVNLFSSVQMMQCAIPEMQKNRWGRIITIGSTQQDKPHPDMLIYSATKSAMLNIVQSLALQLAEHNITVNNVPVGTIYTDRNVEALSDAAYHQKVKEDIPMKRIGNPEDCVDAVLMLSSESGSYITGENLHIDGGKFI